MLHTKLKCTIANVNAISTISREGCSHTWSACFLVYFSMLRRSTIYFQLSMEHATINKYFNTPIRGRATAIVSFKITFCPRTKNCHKQKDVKFVEKCDFLENSSNLGNMLGIRPKL